MAAASDAPPTRKPRWYVPTLPKCLLAVLLVQGVLFVSAHFRWFWFNEHKGYTVVIAVAITSLALLLLGAFALVSRFFKSKSQFGLAALLLIMPVVAIPFGWLTKELDLARKAGEVMKLEGSQAMNRRAIRQWRLAPLDEPSYFSVQCRQIEERLKPLLGEYFFQEITDLTVTHPDALEHVDALTELTSLICQSPLEVDLARLRGLKNLQLLDLTNCKIVGTLEPLRALPALVNLRLDGTDITNEDLKPLGQAEHGERLEGFAKLEILGLSRTTVTDAGLSHLVELSSLTALELKGTQVTADEVKKLQSALPRCLIVY